MCQPSKQSSISSSRDSDLYLSNQRKSIVASRHVHVEFGLLFLSVLYGSIYWLNPPQLVATAEYCNGEGDSLCLRPDLVAYKVTSFVSMTIMAVLGVYNWYYSSPQQFLSLSSTSRLFGALPAADAQNVAILVYQTWDFCVSLTIHEFRAEPIFLVHHVLAAVTAWSSWQMQLFPYYAVYFGGCAEISSVPLVVADMDAMFQLPSMAEPLVGVAKGLFLVSFTYFRVIMWLRWSVQLWIDTIAAKRNGSFEKYRGKTSVGFVYGFLLINVLLTGLQLYWFAVLLGKLNLLINGGVTE